MKITLQRHQIREFATDGKLSIGGIYISDTCERSSYRVPAGTYHIELRYNNLFHRKMPFLMEVPDACLAFGNGIYSCTDGRILLGTTIVPGCLKNSKKTFLRLYDRINQSLRRGHEVELKVIEDSS